MLFMFLRPQYLRRLSKPLGCPVAHEAAAFVFVVESRNA